MGAYLITFQHRKACVRALCCNAERYAMQRQTCLSKTHMIVVYDIEAGQREELSNCVVSRLVRSNSASQKDSVPMHSVFLVSLQLEPSIHC